MCVIIVKPAGVKMPSDEILQAAYNTNPHGCGFATPTKFFKSLSYASFKKRLDLVSDEEPCIIHFRLATHGSIRRANCHPFRHGNVFFAHNGILDIKPKGDWTDSQTAFEKHIYPVIMRYGIDSPMTDLVVKDIIGYSKFAIMQGERLRLFGAFIRQEDGCYYSNLRFTSSIYHLNLKGYYKQCSNWQ